MPGHAVQSRVGIRVRIQVVMDGGGHTGRLMKTGGARRFGGT